jgi:transcriptional regulator of arginine metabolism
LPLLKKAAPAKRTSPYSNPWTTFSSTITDQQPAPQLSLESVAADCRDTYRRAGYHLVQQSLAFPQPIEYLCIFSYNNSLLNRGVILKERLTRLKSVRKLIKNYRIESQEELLGYLQKEGYEVTQATLSRDLKLLKVGKVSDGHSGYVYTLPDEDERRESEQIYVQDFLRGYVSIDYNGNIVVIKTFSGHADSVSNALDAFNMDELLGTIAGENCIFACLREGVTGEQFLTALKLRIPEIEE